MVVLQRHGCCKARWGERGGRGEGVTHGDRGQRRRYRQETSTTKAEANRAGKQRHGIEVHGKQGCTVSKDTANRDTANRDTR